MDIFDYAKEKIVTDVAVIGAGTAGVFAAISAARSGAQTVLIEKNSILGGTVTAACVNFPGLFFAWGKQIISGPCWEAVKRCENLGGAHIPQISYKPVKHWHEQITLNRFVYEAVISQMCRESKVDVILNAMPSYLRETQDGVRILVTRKQGLCEIFAKTVIDATGDANAVSVCGYETVKSEVQQPATQQNHISGYDFEKADTAQMYEKFDGAGFPEYLTCERLVNYLKFHKIDVHIPCRNADTSEGKTAAERNSLELLLKIYSFYRSIRGLENLTVDFIAEETGIRESARIVGETEISAEDYLDGKNYPDSVCYAFYPIDLHVNTGIEQRFLKEDTVGKVPYRALLPKNSKHIICAGRCISSDKYANSALRVEAVCMATGQAAGCAAAISAKQNICVKDVNYGTLCESLAKIGATVPEMQ